MLSRDFSLIHGEGALDRDPQNGNHVDDSTNYRGGLNDNQESGSGLKGNVQVQELLLGAILLGFAKLPNRR